MSSNSATALSVYYPRRRITLCNSLRLPKHQINFICTPFCLTWLTLLMSFCLAIDLLWRTGDLVERRCEQALDCSRRHSAHLLRDGAAFGAARLVGSCMRPIVVSCV